MSAPGPVTRATDIRVTRRRFLAVAGLAGVSAAISSMAPIPVLAARSLSYPSSRHLASALRPGGAPHVRPLEAAGDEPTLANYLAVMEALADGVAPGDLPALAAFLEGDLSGMRPLPAYRLLVGTVFRPDLLEEYASTMLHQTIDRARAAPTTRAAALAWGGADVAEATIVAFQRTGANRFLDLFVDYFDEVLRLRDSKLDLRDDRLGVQVPAWGDGKLVAGRWIAHVTTTARITYAATAFARLTLPHEWLTAYHATARRYVAATERALAVFDRDYRRVPGTDATYYRRPTAGHWEPINHAHQVGRVLLNLHALTGEAEYRRRATQIADVFAQSVAYDRRGYPYWRFFPYFERERDDERAELIWKASCTMPFVHHAARRGRIDPAIADSAARSFVVNLVRDGELNRTVDPARFTALMRDDENVERAAFTAAWLELAPREPMIFDRVVELLVAHRNDYFKRGWFGSPSLARGYAYCLS